MPFSRTWEWTLWKVIIKKDKPQSSNLCGRVRAYLPRRMTLTNLPPPVLQCFSINFTPAFKNPPAFCFREIEFSVSPCLDFYCSNLQLYLPCLFNLSHAIFLQHFKILLYVFLLAFLHFIISVLYLLLILPFSKKEKYGVR